MTSCCLGCGMKQSEKYEDNTEEEQDYEYCEECDNWVCVECECECVIEIN